MARAVEMPCTLKVLKYIETKEGLHPGSLVEEGMIHGNLAWSLSGDKVILFVADDGGDVEYRVGEKTSAEWVEYFLMSQPHGVRIMNPNDFRLALAQLRDI